MSTMSAIFTGVKIIYGVTCIITSIDSLIKNKDNTIVARSISIANKLFSLAVNLAETITHYKACDSAIIQKIKTAKTIGNVIDFGIKITDIFNKILKYNNYIFFKYSHNI